MADLEQMTEASDYQPSCPVKVVEREALAPILPVPVDDNGMWPEPRAWKYQTC